MRLIGCHHQPNLKGYRRLVYLSPVIAVLCLILLSWSNRSGSTVKVSSKNHSSSAQAHVRVQPKSSCGPVRQEPQGEKAAIVPVNGTHTLLLSAYMEHRTEQREVRVLAVAMRSEEIVYRCLLCCQGQHISSKLHITEAQASFHENHFDFAYGTADIMCPLPSDCKTPSHIALTSAVGPEFEGDDPPVFLEVMNLEAKEDSFPHNFTVCISAMFDFTNVLQLAQSMEMLQLLGVSRVVIYKTNYSPGTQRLLDYYVHKGFIEVIPWSMSNYLNVSQGFMPDRDPGDLHYYGQIPALNDCVYRYMYRSKYVALHDMDELILPQTVDSWGELLPQLELNFGVDFCYKFENYVFPNTFKLPPPTPLPDNHLLKKCCSGWENVPGVNILEHLYHEPENFMRYSNHKIIVNPRTVFAPTVHGLLNSQKGCTWVYQNFARMYHTRPPALDDLTADQLVYDDRLLGYSARLVLAVNTVLKEVGFIQDENKN